MTYRHIEAFALMYYACGNLCPHIERIWNSRDGVTPFGGVTCPSCGSAGLTGGLSHVRFASDVMTPGHVLNPGQRFWRDGTPEEAVDIINWRAGVWIMRGSPIPADVLQAMKDQALACEGEWSKGWRFLDQQAMR